MSRNIIGQTSSPLYTVGNQEDKTVSIHWKDGPKYCKICGKELIGRKQRYCSTECKAEGKRRYTEEYHRKLRQLNAEKKTEAKAEKVQQVASVNIPRCIWCNQPLPKGRKVYCSDRCRDKWESASVRSIANETAMQKEAKKKQKKAMTWDQIIKGMEETGMQYGEHVAFVEEKRR